MEGVEEVVGPLGGIVVVPNVAIDAGEHGGGSVSLEFPFEFFAAFAEEVVAFVAEAEDSDGFSVEAEGFGFAEVFEEGYGVVGWFAVAPGADDAEDAGCGGEVGDVFVEGKVEEIDCVAGFGELFVDVVSDVFSAAGLAGKEEEDLVGHVGFEWLGEDGFEGLEGLEDVTFGLNDGEGGVVILVEEEGGGAVAGVEDFGSLVGGGLDGNEVFVFAEAKPAAGGFLVEGAEAVPGGLFLVRKDEAEFGIFVDGFFLDSGDGFDEGRVCFAGVVSANTVHHV